MIRGLHIILFSAVAPWVFAQSSVLSTGSWFKFSVTTEGIYKINYSLLQKAGINPAQIDPRNLKLFAGQPGMVPQPNSAPRVADLQEVAIAVIGESDGKFDNGDYIMFFGQGPDTYNYDTKSDFFSYQNNLFTDKNFYFITISDGVGKRIGQSENLAGSFPVISQFDDFGYYENDLYNLLHSGRQWFGEQFDQSLSLTIQFNLPGIIPNSNIKLTSHVMAQSITSSSFNLSFNNNPVLSQPVAPIPNTPYGIEGIVKVDTIVINESTVTAATQTTQQLKYQFTKGGPGISIGYLDYLIFSCQRSLALYGNQTIFTSAASTVNANATFQVGAVTSGDLIWDVTQPSNVKNQSSELNGSSFIFSTATDTLKKFIVFDPSKAAVPNFESTVANQNLHAISKADLIIITYAPLLGQANRLASFRQSHNQLLPVVATTDAIFNEYGGGKPDFTALRDFIRDVYKKSNGQLKYVLLFGRGSYDYKNRVFQNTNFVPIYESYESLDPLATYSSDDYFGFLQDNEGAWPENPSLNYPLDIGIGRIPAKNSTDATTVVDKLLDYETNTNRFGSWVNNFLFVGDDGDFNIHESQADQLANTIEQTNPYFNANKLFLDSYNQTTTPTGPASPDASKALDLFVRKGMAVVNYTGHGSEQVWTQQQILGPDLVQSWKNGPMYPLFVTATCEFGRNDDPSIISSAELTILQPQGGGIALVTTARPVNSGTNFQLNQAFYQALFTKSNNTFRNLGDIMRDTKDNSLNGVSNRNFSLLGDPSMHLALPNNQIVIDQIKTGSASDTLKALSQVSIAGEIQNNGATLNGFSGTLDATLYDQVQNFVTNGNPADTWNPPATPFSFVARANRLFHGSVSVTQGTFQLDFIMPDNLVPNYGLGKLSMYASATDGTMATGAATNFIVGGVEPSPLPDTTPPSIRLFVSDSTFVDGGTVSANTQLLALLSDQSGINTASLNPQNSIIATLDGKRSYDISDYFVSAKNNFTKGIITYPLDTLKKGKHQLSLTASDTYNNRATVSINFSVAGSAIRVNNFVSYPNPFSADRESTTFEFTHSRAGEDLEATLIIYDLSGRPIANMGYSIPSSTYKVDLGTWNGENTDGTKFGPGLYVARLFVRSLADGSQNEQSAKLIILN